MESDLGEEQAVIRQHTDGHLKLNTAAMTEINTL
jgi:hypothetical protein